MRENHVYCFHLIYPRNSELLIVVGRLPSCKRLEATLLCLLYCLLQRGTQKEEKKENREAKLSFDPRGEYINVEIKYCLGILKYITQLEMQTASYNIYLKKYPCN